MPITIQQNVINAPITLGAVGAAGTNGTNGTNGSDGADGADLNLGIDGGNASSVYTAEQVVDGGGA